MTNSIFPHDLRKGPQQATLYVNDVLIDGTATFRERVNAKNSGYYFQTDRGFHVDYCEGELRFPANAERKVGPISFRVTVETCEQGSPSRYFGEYLKILPVKIRR